MVHALAQTDGREQTADKGPVETKQLMVHIVRSSARVTGTTRSCKLLSIFFFFPNITRKIHAFLGGR